MKNAEVALCAQNFVHAGGMRLHRIVDDKRPFRFYGERIDLIGQLDELFGVELQLLHMAEVDSLRIVRAKQWMGE